MLPITAVIPTVPIVQQEIALVARMDTKSPVTSAYARKHIRSVISIATAWFVTSVTATAATKLINVRSLVQLISPILAIAIATPATAALTRFQVK